MFGNMPIMLTIKMWDPTMLSRFGKSLTGRMLKRDSRMQLLKNKKNRIDINYHPYY